MDSSDARKRPKANSFEHDNGTSGSRRDRNVLAN
jgi:hypothetical protein